MHGSSGSVNSFPQPLWTHLEVILSVGLRQTRLIETTEGEVEEELHFLYELWIFPKGFSAESWKLPSENIQQPILCRSFLKPDTKATN